MHKVKCPYQSIWNEKLFVPVSELLFHIIQFINSKTENNQLQSMYKQAYRGHYLVKEHTIIVTMLQFTYSTFPQ
jgi:hypothetical protein